MTTTGNARLAAAGIAQASGHTTPAAGTPGVYDLRTAAYLPAQHDVDLSSAARLEMGLSALENGRMPEAFAALAAIPERDWQAVLRRFPMLTVWMEQEARR